mmetsp:Transcript_13046/g.28962  ORF Transcript_13046/g.28962 Transcript_13046/m.28962 type:complete len:426 (+) Transcript_13046:2850-4127(+)
MHLCPQRLPRQPRFRDALQRRLHPQQAVRRSQEYRLRRTVRGHSQAGGRAVHGHQGGEGTGYSGPQTPRQQHRESIHYAAGQAARPAGRAGPRGRYRGAAGAHRPYEPPLPIRRNASAPRLLCPAAPPHGTVPAHRCRTRKARVRHGGKSRRSQAHTQNPGRTGKRHPRVHIPDAFEASKRAPRSLPRRQQRPLLHRLAPPLPRRRRPPLPVPPLPLAGRGDAAQLRTHLPQALPRAGQPRFHHLQGRPGPAPLPHGGARFARETAGGGGGPRPGQQPALQGHHGRGGVPHAHDRAGQGRRFGPAHPRHGRSATHVHKHARQETHRAGGGHSARVSVHRGQRAGHRSAEAVCGAAGQCGRKRGKSDHPRAGRGAAPLGASGHRRPPRGAARRVQVLRVAHSECGEPRGGVWGTRVQGDLGPCRVG